MSGQLGLQGYGAAVGAFISVRTEADMTALDVSRLTLGTFAFVTSEGNYYQLVTDVSNNLIWQQVSFSGGGGTVHTASPVTGDGSSGNPITMPAATDSTAGYQSAADKAKLDSVPLITDLASIVLASPATNVDFTGLNGSSDGNYEFTIRLASGSTGNTLIQPNASGANLSGNGIYVSGSSVSALGAQSVWYAVLGGATFFAKGSILSKTSVFRSYFVQGYQQGSGIAFYLSGQWSDTTTNIASIRFNCTTTNGFASGSIFTLRKLGTP